VNFSEHEIGRDRDLTASGDSRRFDFGVGCSIRRFSADCQRATSEPLQQVVSQTHQIPFILHLLQAPHEEIAKLLTCIDLTAL
jgi:hypothetical protein